MIINKNLQTIKIKKIIFILNGLETFHHTPVVTIAIII